LLIQLGYRQSALIAFGTSVYDYNGDNINNEDQPKHVHLQPASKILPEVNNKIMTVKKKKYGST
jgi:hypothetical protein